MPRCFVIQPFDGGQYDQRFDEVFKPAITGAELEAYRVDRDARASVLNEAIEIGIRNSIICLADISGDNPNVWYELGYAFAARKPVVMVCSRERNRFPFDIQHRKIITYGASAPSDFNKLQSQITEHLKALLEEDQEVQQLAAGVTVPVAGLSASEVTLLAVLASSTRITNSPASAWLVEQKAEKAGLNEMAISLNIRRLKVKHIVRSTQIENNYGESYPALEVTDKGWDWIDKNENLFTFRRPNEVQERVPYVDMVITDDDIPF